MAEIPHATRQVVYQRDGGRCQACGTSIYLTTGSVQHRHARGTGGTNDLSNLILLCGSGVTGCHGLCEKRDGTMHARGFWVYSWEVVAEVPAELYDGRWVLLDDDGGYGNGDDDGTDDGAGDGS